MGVFLFQVYFIHSFVALKFACLDPLMLSVLVFRFRNVSRMRMTVSPEPVGPHDLGLSPQSAVGSFEFSSPFHTLMYRTSMCTFVESAY